MPKTGVAWTRHVQRAIEAALAEESKLCPEILELEGFSSPTTRSFLNSLCSTRSVNYLEVGVWKGSTLISASYKNTGQFTGIDNFSEWSLGAKDTFTKARKRFR